MNGESSDKRPLARAADRGRWADARGVKRGNSGADLGWMGRRSIFRWITSAGVAVAIGTSGVLGCELGGRIGFEQGAAKGFASSNVLDGGVAVEALSAIRAGDNRKAISFLETMLDGALTSYWAHTRQPPSRFDRTVYFSPGMRRFAAKIGAYRDGQPSPHVDETGLISEVLAQIASERAEDRER